MSGKKDSRKKEVRQIQWQKSDKNLEKGRKKRRRKEGSRARIDRKKWQEFKKQRQKLWKKSDKLGQKDGRKQCDNGSNEGDKNVTFLVEKKSIKR